jgi:hypothetical protein
VKQRLFAAAQALRQFLAGFVGTAPVRPGACHEHDAAARRPFCC